MSYKLKVLLCIIILAFLIAQTSADYSSTWIDTFTDSTYVLTNNNINISDGYAHLLNSQSRGNITSVAINAYALTKWDMFYIQSGGLGDGNTNLSFGFLRSDLTPILECYANASYLTEQDAADSIAKNFAGTGAFDEDWLSGTILSLTANYTAWQNFTIIPDVTTNATYNGSWSIEQDKEDAHNCSGTFDSSCTNAFDEDWTTFTDTTYGNSGTIFENFTIPSGTSKANFTYYGNSGSIYCYNSSNEWTAIIPSKSAVGTYTGDIPSSCLLTTTLQIETSVSNGVIYRVYYEGKVTFSGENYLHGILTKDTKYVNPYWVLKYKSDTAVWNISCWNNNSNSWYPLIYDNSHDGETTTSFKIPYSCIYRNSILYLYENMDNVGSGAIYYEDKVSWNVTLYKAINISTASSGFNASTCLGTQTPIYLFAGWEGNSSSPLLLDWNITYLQSESGCYDYDGGLNYDVGSNVTKQTSVYKDSCTGSTLIEYYCDAGLVKSASYTCPQVCQDSTRCRQNCVGNVSAWSYYIATNSSQVQYILFNLTPVDNVKLNATNVISLKQSWQRSGREFIVNVTGNANSVIYLSDDITNISYSQPAITPNLTLQLTFANFTRIGNYYNISWFVEENWSQKFDNDLVLEHKLYVYCDSSGTFYKDIKTANITSLVIASSERPQNFQSFVKWDSVNTYTRSVIPFSDTSNTTIYLIDLRNYTAVAMIFSLTDLTNGYNNAYLRLQKYVDGVLTDMNSDWFGADAQVLAYLIDNYKYTLVVGNQGTLNDTKQAGWITASAADTSKTITVTAPFDSSHLITPFDFIHINYTKDYNSSQICGIYLDDRGRTVWAYFQIYNASKSLLWNYSAPTPSSWTSCYNVPNNNASYILRVYFSHPDCSTPDIQWVVSLFEGITKLITPHIPESGFLGMTMEQIYTGTSVFIITSVALIFGALHSGLAGLIVSGTTTLLVFVGWITFGASTVLILFTMWTLSIAGKLAQRRGAS